MNKNEVPISIVIEHSQRYTPKQIKILYGDEIRQDNRYKKYIQNLYEKAERLNDEVAIELLCSRYDMIAIFEKDVSGLPQVTKQQTDKSFKNIYEMIKKINPYDDEVIIRKRRYSINKEKHKRRYGSKSFCTCFKETDGGVYFSIRSYLYKTTLQT